MADREADVDDRRLGLGRGDVHQVAQQRAVALEQAARFDRDLGARQRAAGQLDDARVLDLDPRGRRQEPAGRDGDGRRVLAARDGQLVDEGVGRRRRSP